MQNLGEAAFIAGTSTAFAVSVGLALFALTLFAAG
jgi:hypothetical protein